MDFSPGKVVAYLHSVFGCEDDPLNDHEESIAKELKRIIEEAVDGILEIQSGNEILFEDGGDSDFSIDDEEDTVKFGDRIISDKMLTNAVEFYQSKQNGVRSLSCMSNRYKFIKGQSDIRQLQRIIKNGHISRSRRINQLGLLLFEEVKEIIEHGKVLHDYNLQSIVTRINKKNDLVTNFKASHVWLNKWKRKYGISSRRWTKIVSIKNMKDKAKLKDEGALFVEETRNIMEGFDLAHVINGDQSGFVKEMYSNRTLSFTGSKTVEVVAKNVSATQHSYTILPIIKANGTLSDKLYVVLQEPGGRFPQKGHIMLDNLIVRASSSHIMTKSLMLDWFRECVLHPSSPTHQLVLVDSWSSFKDHASIQSIVPRGKKLTIRNIPSGTTSFIQPLDVYFFHPFKAMVKRVTSFVQINENVIDFPVHQRDNRLKIISLIYKIFMAPVFQSMLEYPWKKAGYIYSVSRNFKTPVQVCFPPGIDTSNCHISTCSEDSFILCPHCDQPYCFACFFIEYHVC